MDNSPVVIEREFFTYWRYIRWQPSELHADGTLKLDDDGEPIPLIDPATGEPYLWKKLSSKYWGVLNAFFSTIEPETRTSTYSNNMISRLLNIDLNTVREHVDVLVYARLITRKRRKLGDTDDMYMRRTNAPDSALVTIVTGEELDRRYSHLLPPPVDPDYVPPYWRRKQIFDIHGNLR